MPNRGVKFLRSPRVNQILSEESKDHLLKLGADLAGETIVQTTLCKDKLIAFSYLKPTRDEFGRQGVWNHTILVPCSAIHKFLLDRVDLHFMKETGDLSKAVLRPISVNILEHATSECIQTCSS
jgi:hypothetical protein